MKPDNRRTHTGWRRWEELTPDEQQTVLLRWQLHVRTPSDYAYWVLPNAQHGNGKLVCHGCSMIFCRRPIGQIRNWCATSPFED